MNRYSLNPPSEIIRKVEDMLLTGICIKRIGDAIGYSMSAGYKISQTIIHNAGHETREQYMAAEINRLRKQLKGR